MRKSASEKIDDLQQRVERLEKKAGFFDFLTGNISLRDIESLIKREHKTADVDFRNLDRISFSFELGSSVYWFEGHFLKNKKKIRASSLSSIALFNKLRGGSPKGMNLNDSSLLVIEFTPDYRKMGIKPTPVGSLYIYIDTYDKQMIKSDFKDRLKLTPVIKSLRKSQRA